MASGKVKKWFPDRGTGWIIDQEDGADVFFGDRALSGLNVTEIHIGLEVDFDRIVQERGPAARNVRRPGTGLSHREAVPWARNRSAGERQPIPHPRTSRSRQQRYPHRVACRRFWPPIWCRSISVILVSFSTSFWILVPTRRNRRLRGPDLQRSPVIGNGWTGSFFADGRCSAHSVRTCGVGGPQPR